MHSASLNLLYVNEFYIGMSKKFQYLSVSKGHYKASLVSTENSTFVARVVYSTVQYVAL